MLIALTKKTNMFATCATFMKSLRGGADVNVIVSIRSYFVLQLDLVSYR